MNWGFLVRLGEFTFSGLLKVVILPLTCFFFIVIIFFVAYEVVS